jgi:hypothetical protein
MPAQRNFEKLYNEQTRVLKQAVRGNTKRFSNGFVFGMRKKCKLEAPNWHPGKGADQDMPNVVNGERCGNVRSEPEWLNGCKKRNRRNERDKPDKLN